VGTEEQALHSDDPVSAIYPQALPLVYGYLLPRCGSVDLAEDLTSDTFMAAVAAVNGPAPPTLSTAWLIGVARHKLVDHWRRQERDRRRLTAMEDTAEDQTELWDAQLDTAAAYEAFARLSANHRSALLCATWTTCRSHRSPSIWAEASAPPRPCWREHGPRFGASISRQEENAMADPLDVLRMPIVPIEPRREFASNLLRRVRHE
jgi:DNA-directed RNA polymerase specialized sigma24 family protein